MKLIRFDLPDWQRESWIQRHKRSQLFVRTHNETFSVVAIRVSNPDRPSLRING